MKVSEAVAQKIDKEIRKLVDEGYNQAKEILTLKDKLNKILADKTKQSLKKIQTDTERDFFMNAEEAVKYGIIDEVLKERK